MAGPRHNEEQDSSSEAFQACTDLLVLAHQSIVACQNILRANDKSKMEVAKSGYENAKEYLSAVADEIKEFKDELKTLQNDIEMLKKKKSPDKAIQVRQAALLEHMKDLEKLKDKGIKALTDFHKVVTKDFTALTAKIGKEKSHTLFFAVDDKSLTGAVESKKVTVGNGK